LYLSVAFASDIGTSAVPLRVSPSGAGNAPAVLLTTCAESSFVWKAKNIAKQKMSFIAVRINDSFTSSLHFS
jgi:hypothetical protein